SYYHQCGPPRNAGFRIVLTEDGTAGRFASAWDLLADRDGQLQEPLHCRPVNRDASPVWANLKAAPARTIKHEHHHRPASPGEDACRRQRRRCGGIRFLPKLGALRRNVLRPRTEFGGPRGRDRRRRRQLEQERRAFAGLRLQPDVAAHAADELVADVEAEPGTADAAGHLRVDAVELLEDAALLVDGDPEALVANVEDHVALVRLDADLDHAAIRRVLDRVLDEVDEHLPDLVAVGLDERHAVGDAVTDLHARRGVRAGRLDDALDQLGGVEGLRLEVEPAGVELARQQNLVDDPAKALGLVGDQRDEAVTAALVEGEVVSEQRLRGAVDGGQRRPQLVGRGRDEARLQLL